MVAPVKARAGSRPRLPAETSLGIGMPSWTWEVWPVRDMPDILQRIEGLGVGVVHSHGLGPSWVRLQDQREAQDELAFRVLKKLFPPESGKPSCQVRASLCERCRGAEMEVV